VIASALRHAKEQQCRLHLLGLVSDGGVHSSLEHLFALINAAYEEGVPVVVHAFLDGRDTPPQSAGTYLQKLSAVLENKGVIGTVSGRYYAMDRDKRWERVHKAYTAIVRGEAPRAATAGEALAASYVRGVNDEFVEPVRIGDYDGIKGDFMADFAAGERPVWTWVGQEVGFAFNFRPDRMRELSAMLIRKNLPPEVLELLADRGKPVVAFDEGWYSTMTDYDPALNLPVAFPKDQVRDSFGEVLSRHGLSQFRCAETEKYAHVTYFFNGGREAPFEGEARQLVPSPRDVATYDQKPEMSAAGVTAYVVDAIKSGKYDFILVNFANPDMVGHTGNLEAAIKAVETVDAGIGAILSALREAGGALILTSDHGNCEQMKDAAGLPHTAHTTNPVPLYYANFAQGGHEGELRPGGRICDVAPTMLEILGIPQPAAMTGVSLLQKG
jgi:2,3-bisphosphoglycerate-independent phosphoglycerate mutase